MAALAAASDFFNSSTQAALVGKFGGVLLLVVPLYFFAHAGLAGVDVAGRDVDNHGSEGAHFGFEFVIILVRRKILRHFEDLVIDVIEIPL